MESSIITGQQQPCQHRHTQKCVCFPQGSCALSHLLSTVYILSLFFLNTTWTYTSSISLHAQSEGGYISQHTCLHRHLGINIKTNIYQVSQSRKLPLTEQAFSVRHMCSRSPKLTGAPLRWRSDGENKHIKKYPGKI